MPTLEAASSVKQPHGSSITSKRQREQQDGDDGLRQFFRSWAWKREHRPDKERFQRPYPHSMKLPGAGSGGEQQVVQLSIQQKKFTAEGFASTVWDSSIVVAKYAERWPELFAGKRCLDLSAGCGLVAVVMARLGAAVTATDLGGNLQLLRDNCMRNDANSVTVAEHRWGEPAPHLMPPFDVICCCDVMYVTELVQPLLSSLLMLSHADTIILVAHGRNRPAEPAFKAAAAQHFTVDLVTSHELDATYQCSDVDVLRLRRRREEAAAGAAAAEAKSDPLAVAAAAGNTGSAMADKQQQQSEEEEEEQEEQEHNLKQCAPAEQQQQQQQEKKQRPQVQKARKQRNQKAEAA